MGWYDAGLCLAEVVMSSEVNSEAYPPLEMLYLQLRVTSKIVVHIFLL